MRIRASLALLLAVSGCSTTYKVPKAELVRLDGWYVPDLVTHHTGDGRLATPERVTLRDVEGREHAFTEDTPLVLVQNDGGVIAEKYIDLKIDEQTLRGVPLNAFRRSVELPLGEVKTAGIREVSVGRTLLLVGAVGLGLVGTIVGLDLALGGPPTQPSPNPCGGTDCPF
ncbi:hypothetical protein [Hyalangium versicolor]|uniref:hypothetical protein n=1 Tax=Hyalangium versicolor TaxID=2861190 RepID=UPI001CCFF74B|nr:hypothetical protein [Hyalangium versicolor]